MHGGRQEAAGDSFIGVKREISHFQFEMTGRMFEG